MCVLTMFWYSLVCPGYYWVTQSAIKFNSFSHPISPLPVLRDIGCDWMELIDNWVTHSAIKFISFSHPISRIRVPFLHLEWQFNLPPWPRSSVLFSATPEALRALNSRKHNILFAAMNSRRFSTPCWRVQPCQPPNLYPVRSGQYTL